MTAPEVLKIVHVGAFRGNMGDYANHSSFYEWFERILAPKKINWQELDIREVWRGNRDLGESLRKVGHDTDLIVLGGGNFWETWDSSSRSGTSLNVTYPEFKALGIPVFFNSLGVETSRGISKNAQKVFFEDFENYGFDNQFFVSLRNDGSIQNLSQRGVDVTNAVTLPDHGFFFEATEEEKPQIRKPRLLVNLAKDMREQRYGEIGGYELFIKDMAQILKDTYSLTQFELLFYCQIPTDVEVGTDLFSLLPESMVRNDASLSFPNSSFGKGNKYFGPFCWADLVLAQRFHSTVLGLISNADLISISNHSKVVGLHEQLETNQKYLNPIHQRSDLQTLRQVLTPERLLASSETVAPEEKFNFSKVIAQRVLVEKKLLTWLKLNSLL